VLGVQCDFAVGLNDLTDQQGHNGGDDALGSAELQGNRHSREDGEGQRDTGRDLAQAAQEVDRQQVEQVDDHLQATPYTAPMTPEAIMPFLVSGHQVPTMSVVSRMQWIRMMLAAMDVGRP